MCLLKVQELKAVRDASEQKIDIMKDDLDEMKTWKDKVCVTL